MFHNHEIYKRTLFFRKKLVVRKKNTSAQTDGLFYLFPIPKQMKTRKQHLSEQGITGKYCNVWTDMPNMMLLHFRIDWIIA